MSKYNKVNKDHYVQGGRLTPDEAARQRQKQAEISAEGKERVSSKAPAPKRDEQDASRPRSAPEE